MFSEISTIIILITKVIGEELNQIWFAARIMEITKSVDQVEAALDQGAKTLVTAYGNIV